MYWRPKLRVRRNSLEVSQPVGEQVRLCALVRQTVLRHTRLPEERITFLLLRPQLGGKTVSSSHVLSQLERGADVSEEDLVVHQRSLRQWGEKCCQPCQARQRYQRLLCHG